MVFIYCLMAFAGFLIRGPIGAIAMVVAHALFVSMLLLIKEMTYMRKYRDEYIKCADAVLANSVEMADRVNAWSVHYYVHKTFHMSNGKDGLSMGYYLSVRDRPREPNW